MPLAGVQAELVKVFEKKGRPDRIKVDNGLPFGEPSRTIVPVLALWLIGHNVRMVWNRPRTPQDNAKVER